MRGTDELAGVLALTRASNKALSQPERLELLLEGGAAHALAQVTSGPVGTADMFGSADLIAEARRDINRWYDRGIQMITALEPDYPHQLLTVREAPALLYYEGRIIPDDQAVAIVGSRAIAAPERRAAADIARGVADLGLTIVSGLAKGIDAAAHAAAIEAGARTVAVMGTSIEQTYPAENRELRESIVASGGLVFTQFDPDSHPSRASFPMRNVTMSGYSIATIVVAAGERSGTRHQARRALAHGRNVILLPGVVEDNQWAQDLSHRPGVFIARSVDDVKSILDQARADITLLSESLV